MKQASLRPISLTVAGLALLIPTLMAATYDLENLAEWREAHANGLLKEEGWLSVAGLLWLKEGENVVGSKEGAEVPLPKAGSPEALGTLTLSGGKVTLKVAAGVDLTVNGKPFAEGVVKTDAEGAPDRIKYKDLTLKVIKRGARWAVRLWDLNAETRKEFKGLNWFAPNSDWVVEAKFVQYDPPKTLQIVNVLGDTEPTPSPGYLELSKGGKKFTLDVQDSGDEYFLNFRDLTHKDATYGAGRFLYIPKGKNGKVLVDFNRATNPPCAYTAYATCPLPPKQNHLDLRIEAGEKRLNH